VEDTFNLLGHAARKIVACAAKMTDTTSEEICRKAGIPLLLSSSIKAGLDINWNDPEQKDEAIEKLTAQVSSLNDWLDRHRLAMEEPLKPYLEALSQVRKQDLEVSKGHVRLRRGVAEDRRVSLEDADMRHGRKTKNKRFNGFKQHIAADLDSETGDRSAAAAPLHRYGRSFPSQESPRSSSRKPLRRNRSASR
jgi:hypothetical protein